MTTLIICAKAKGTYAMSIDKAAGYADDSHDFIRAKIAGKSYVQIDRLDNTLSWSEPVHAINWFNTRFMPLYNFYNLVAARSVTRVGGKPIFKGRLTKHITGDNKDLRTVLLLVRYPSPVNFKNMAENLYFKVVSLLRAMAVQDFTFCLSRVTQTNSVPATLDATVSFAAHHFRGSTDTIDKVQVLADASSVKLDFASVKTHVLSSGGGKGTTAIESLMDGLILLSAPDTAELESLFASVEYKHIIDQTESSFIGLFKRLM